ncbi:retrovirus-related Pol polyprotein from transposon 17.6 [Trichonephila clavipes]|nr:retrovirus-related Pol polyprotein from transposon 17.6 [Trichonephila clavipes]
MCQINNYKNALPAGRLIPIVSNYPNEIVTLDLLGPYLVSRARRNRYVLVITNHFSKWAEIIPLKKASNRVIADNFFDNYTSRFGAPIKLISDNGPYFISDIFENLSERLGIRHVKTVAYRPQANRTERVNRDLVQIIANYVNEQHDTWDQFLREFAYAIRMTVNETTGKPPAELFLGRKLITPFQKLVMVSDGMEFAVGDIERLFEEARRNTKAKHEKWETQAVLDVKNNNVVIWKAGKRLTINEDQVRIYRHRKCDETKVGSGSSDNGSLRDESSGFYRVQRRSKESQDGKKKGSEKEKPMRRNSNAHHKRLQPQTTKWKKSGVPTNHTEEDTTGRTSSIQKKQRKERQSLHRRANKINQQECQTRRGSTTAGPGKEKEHVRESLYFWRSCCQVIYSQFGLAIHQNDHQARRRFVEWAQNEIAVVPDFHKRILFSDEAHFWLNGYVNKQNCHIWSEANPQVYVETPLHPEKLTVWCALWAGGILLQKR